jgi:SEC-C motif-containing protein
VSTPHCHCGQALPYKDCCGRFISGRELPQTAELLMRSRYSAFVEQDEAYLLDTWHPATRPSRVRFNPAQRWLGLSIRQRDAGKAGDETGTVEFVARFKVGGKGRRLHETSRFETIDDRWYYRDGTHH